MILQFQAILLALILLTSISITREQRRGNDLASRPAKSEIARDESNDDNAKKIAAVGSAQKKKTEVLYSKTVAFSKNAAEQFLVASAIIDQKLLEAVDFSARRLFSERKFESEESVAAVFSAETVAAADADVPPPYPLSGNYDFQSFCGKTNALMNNLDVQAALIKNLTRDFPMFELNPDKRWPIASLTKLMASVVAAEKIGVDEKAAISKEAVSSDGLNGNFKAGEIFTVADLIKAMMTVSSNDAAAATAEMVGEKEFVDEMQKKTAELKMFNTTFLEPTGLSFVNQSTVSDISRLMAYIYLKQPKILEISRQKETEIRELNSNRKRRLPNINHFAGAPDFLGGKTGYIEEAQRNMAAVFDIGGQPILTVVFGADDAFKETEKLKNFIEKCTTYTFF